MKTLLIVVAILSLLAGAIVAFLVFAIAAMCSDCSLNNFLDPTLISLILLAAAFLVAGVGLLRRRKWALFLAIPTWLASAAASFYGDDPDRAALSLLGLLMAMILFLPTTRQLFHTSSATPLVREWGSPYDDKK